MLSRSDLHDYQVRACDFIKATPRCALLLEMGLGKTISTLTAIRDLIDYCDISRVLVIAPKMVAATTWRDESSVWEHTRHLSVFCAVGDAKHRAAALNSYADITTIGRDNIQWLADQYPTGLPFDMVVLDELSSYKDSKTKRFKVLRKLLAGVPRVVGLTGTPTPNSLLELWPQICLLDGGQRLGRTMTGYRDRWFAPAVVNGPIVYKWRLKAGADKEILSRISDITLSMRSCDYLTLPDRIDIVREFDLPPSAAKAYKDIKDEYITNQQGETIIASNAAVVAGKLLQICNGSLYTDEHDVVRLHDCKIEMLREIVEASSSPVLVFYSLKADVTAIQSAMPNAETLDGEDTIARWCRGEIPVLLLHPASAGHGLNLQSGGHTIVWYGLTWSLEQYEQANARLHRQGQKMPVTVYHLTARHTIEQVVLRTLRSRKNVQDAVIAYFTDVETS